MRRARFLLHKLPPVFCVTELCYPVTTVWVRNLHPGKGMRHPGWRTLSGPSEAGGSTRCSEEPTRSDLLRGRFLILSSLRASGRSQEKLGLENRGGLGVWNSRGQDQMISVASAAAVSKTKSGALARSALQGLRQRQHPC